MHNLAPYFVEICFDRLSTVYVSPIELKLDVEFFDTCTVSLQTLTTQDCRFLRLKLVSLWMQEFIYCIVPLVFKISFTAELPLAMNILHSLLEDFLWHYYYSKAYSGLFKFLGHVRQFRNSAIKLSASVIFKKSLATLKCPGFKLESSEVPFIFNAFHFLLLVSH